MRSTPFLLLLLLAPSCDAVAPGAREDAAPEADAPAAAMDAAPWGPEAAVPCPPALLPGAAGVPLDDPRITGWAAAVAAVAPGAGLDDAWTDASRALGPAEGNAAEVVSLGRGGSITLVFDPPLRDGPGDDLAVYENSFSPTFLELAFVEVSSDGVVFERFDSRSLWPDPVGPFGETDPAAYEGLAGVHPKGLGTAFDLSLLACRAAATSGALDLDRVSQVRVVDVVGDGSTTDSFGNPVYAPYPTTGSAGFDLDGIAALADDP
ncbi:MAG: PEP-CTERM sorting domain-containing protein [Deltaproteobacteria bacterium]|nr:PEP-CTERM sorting domain-containing protein [Deltaproteobacteria bacterium]